MSRAGRLTCVFCRAAQGKIRLIGGIKVSACDKCAAEQEKARRTKRGA